ncbi:hypothetical protein BG005_008959 [Podila minutissima]|nr:hypothetical protein BG005_008959 [Podila minutissima]
MGRNDDQVKIHGFRIELGEIEAHLIGHPNVRDASVLLLDTILSNSIDDNNKQLVTYVIATPDEHLVHELCSHLMTRLPEYMIPAAFVCIDALPLNTNGKLD